MKIWKNGDFWHKEFVFSIANLHLCAKNVGKTNVESLRNWQKTGFPAYYRYFRPENFFEIQAPSLGITISHLCAENQESL